MRATARSWLQSTVVGALHSAFSSVEGGGDVGSSDDLVLYNLVVSDDALRSIDPSGTIERCTIKELHVTFPWQALFTEATRVRIVCVEVVIRVDIGGPLSEGAAAQARARSGAAQGCAEQGAAEQGDDAPAREPTVENTTADAAAAPPPPEWIVEWIKPIVQHLAIEIDNVVVKLHFATATFTLAVRAVSIDRTAAAHRPPGAALAGLTCKTVRFRETTLALDRSAKQEAVGFAARAPSPLVVPKTNAVVRVSFLLDAILDALLGGDSAEQRAAKRRAAQRGRMRTAAMLMLGFDDFDAASTDSTASAPLSGGRAPSAARAERATEAEIAAELLARGRLAPPLLAPRAPNLSAVVLGAPPTSDFFRVAIELERCNATLSEQHIALLREALLVDGAASAAAGRTAAAAATAHAAADCGAQRDSRSRSALGAAARQLGALAPAQQEPARGDPMQSSPGLIVPRSAALTLSVRELSLTLLRLPLSTVHGDAALRSAASPPRRSAADAGAPGFLRVPVPKSPAHPSGFCVLYTNPDAIRESVLSEPDTPELQRRRAGGLASRRAAIAPKRASAAPRVLLSVRIEGLSVACRVVLLGVASVDVAIDAGSCIDAVAITTPASRGACARGTKLGADGAAPTERDRGATWLVAESLRCSVAWHEVGDFSAHGDASANARSHDTTSTATDSSGAAERGIEHIFDTERRTAALLGRRARSGRWPFAQTPSPSHASAPGRAEKLVGAARRAQPRRERGYSEADAGPDTAAAARERRCSQVALIDCAAQEVRFVDPASLARVLVAAKLLPLLDTLACGGAAEPPPAAAASAEAGELSLHARVSVQRASVELRAPPELPSSARVAGASQHAAGARVAAQDVSISVAVRRGGGDWLSDGALGGSVGAGLSTSGADIAVDGRTLCSVRRFVVQGQADRVWDDGLAGDALTEARECEARCSAQCASIRATLSPRRVARLVAAALAQRVAHGASGDARGEDADVSSAIQATARCAEADVIALECNGAVCATHLSAVLRGRCGALCASSRWHGHVEAALTHAAVNIERGDAAGPGPRRTPLLHSGDGRALGSASGAGSGAASRAESGDAPRASPGSAHPALATTRAGIVLKNIGPLIPAAVLGLPVRAGEAHAAHTASLSDAAEAAALAPQVALDVQITPSTLNVTRWSEAQEILVRVVAALRDATSATGTVRGTARGTAAGPAAGAAAGTAIAAATAAAPSLAGAIEGTARTILRDDANLTIGIKVGTSDGRVPLACSAAPRKSSERGGPTCSAAPSPPGTPFAASRVASDHRRSERVAAELDACVARMPPAAQHTGRECLEEALLAVLRAEAAQLERLRCEAAVEARFSR